MDFIKRHRYTSIIALIFFVQFLTRFVVQMHPYMQVNYVIDYSSGFGPRKLIGSILNLLVPGDNVNFAHVIVFLVVANALVIALASSVIGNFIKSTLSIGNTKIYYFALLMCAVYIVGPFGLQYLFHNENFGRMDLFIIACCFIFISITHTKRPLFYLSSAILMVASCLIHQIFVCVFLPLFCAVYIYRIFKADHWRKEATYGVLSMGVLTMIFMCIQFFPPNIYSLSEIVPILQSKTDLSIDKMAVFYEYYAPISHHLFEYVPMYIDRLIISFVTSLLILSPLLYLLVIFWEGVINSSDNKKYRLTIRLINDAFLLSIPAFICTIDHGRWISALITCQFMIIGWLIYNNDNNVIVATKDFMAKVKSHPFLSVMFIVYMGSVDCYEAGPFLPLGKTVYNILTTIYYVSI